MSVMESRVGRFVARPALSLILFLTVMPVGLGVQPALARSAAGGSGQYEINFMETMIGHHQTAVLMGDACLAQAAHPDLIKQCHTIVASQSGEIITMQMYLKQWYGIKFSARVAPQFLHFLTAVAPYGGAQFDQVFLRNMIAHHAIAIDMAKTCLQRATHLNLKTTCSNIIVSQTQEIATQRAWLCKWYHQCSGARENTRAAATYTG